MIFCLLGFKVRAVFCGSLLPGLHPSSAPSCLAWSRGTALSFEQRGLQVRPAAGLEGDKRRKGPLSRLNACFSTGGGFASFAAGIGKVLKTKSSGLGKSCCRADFPRRASLRSSTYWMGGRERGGVSRPGKKRPSPNRSATSSCPARQGRQRASPFD